MNSLRFLSVIVPRGKHQAYFDFLEERGIKTVLGMPCKGTANRKTLDFLGIEDTEKVLLQAVIPGSSAKLLFQELVSLAGINMPGNGIALTVPLSNVGGATALKYLTQGQNLNTEEGIEMVEPMYSLIVVIAEKDSTDMVMEAARGAGARGGTVLHAKGTANAGQAKFFGISIAEEKEMLYILTPRDNRDNIMRAILEQAGPRTEAHAMAFSLPVDNIAGLRNLTEEEK